MPVSLDVKTKIVFNGKVYERPADMPEAERRIYEQAIAAVSGSESRATTAAVVDGVPGSDPATSPSDARPLHNRLFAEVGGEAVNVDIPQSRADVPQGWAVPLDPVGPEPTISARALVTLGALIAILWLAAAFLF